MKKLLLWLIVMLVGISMVATFSLAGCKVEEAAPEEEVAEEVEEVAEEVIEEASAELEVKEVSPAEELNLHFISTLLGHPVVRITSAGFLKACYDYGYNGKLLAPEGHDTEILIKYFEQAIAEGSDGILSWSTDVQAFYPVIIKAREAGIPVIEVHCVLPEPVANAYIGPNQDQYCERAADTFAELFEKEGVTEGKIAITSGSFNDTENYVATKFTEFMNEKYPQFTILEQQEEGFDPVSSIQVAVSIIIANPDIVGAFSTTGGGPTTWGKAKQEAKRKDIKVISMDTVPASIDLLLEGWVDGLVCQALFEESYGAVELIKKIYEGEKVKYWNYMDSPIVTKENVDYWVKQNEEVEQIHEEYGFGK